MVDDIGSLWWQREGRRAAEAAMRRLHPSKLAASIEAAAPHALAECEAAWAAYRDDAAAALFDVLDFLDAIELPAPCDVQDEIERLAHLALSGKGASNRKGAHPPLVRHEAALKRRRKHDLVARVMLEGRLHRREDDPTCGAIAHGADPTILEQMREHRREASDKVMRAAEIAERRAKLNVNPLRYYEAYNELENYYNENRNYAGCFYIPSEATCLRLEWNWVNDIVAAGVSRRDSPSLDVA